MVLTNFGEEQTRLVYQSESQQVSIEREQSSVNAEVDRKNSSVVIEADSGEVVKLHESILELVNC
jgi:hypothetical protein